MLFGFTDDLTTYVCGHENMTKFIAFKNRNHSGKESVVTVEETDPFEHLMDDTLKLFKETILRVTHSSKQNQEKFISENDIKILHPFDCQTEQELMVFNYEDIKERDAMNAMRLEAFSKGEMPKTTIADLYFSDKEDIYDKRTDEEKETDAAEKERVEKEILARISKGENTVPLTTNVDKEDREAKDMSHLRREQNDDLMDDFDPEEDIVDPEELKAVMEYQEKVLHARTQEEKDKLKEELNSKLSEKTILAREGYELEVAKSQKAVENAEFSKILKDEAENYKNGIHKSNTALDREIKISIDSDLLNSDIKNNISLINNSIDEVNLIDLPLSSINNGYINLPSGRVPFEIGEKSIVAWQNLKSVSRTSVINMTSINFNIVNELEDCYVLYCDNTLDENNKIKGIPFILRIKPNIQ